MLEVANDESYKHAKSQFKIFCILIDIKNEKSVNRSIVISNLQRNSDFVIFVYSGYQIFRIEILHVCGIHH
jgi:hypothetical protein